MNPLSVNYPNPEDFFLESLQHHDELYEFLSIGCSEIYDSLQPSIEDVEDRNAALFILEKYIRVIYPDANLRLFGSSRNGFGFKGCDMDICLTFENHPLTKNISFIYMVETLALHLNDSSEYSNVKPITRAKVPIVKFTFERINIEADISFYNVLAQYNTELLKSYCKIDNRVKLLGFVIKYFVKTCNIGDASCGTLSSYAYILMVIYFLQQRSPPVIPVLQELYNKSKPRPKRYVENWNVWFYDDVEQLDDVWPHSGENKESIGELLLGFFQFYSETFQFTAYVICIRQHKLMTRAEKRWDSECFAIEDPFKLIHNLGSGLSFKMNRYICQILIRGRDVFGRINLKNNHHSLAILFNRDILTNGIKRPNGKCCKICNKISHKTFNCPLPKKI